MPERHTLPYRTWQCTGQDSGLKAPLALLSLLHLPSRELDTGNASFLGYWLLKTAASNAVFDPVCDCGAKSEGRSAASRDD